MSDRQTEWGLTTETPLQYAVGQPCDECGNPLSRYNPYTVCGPCRRKLVLDTSAEMAQTSHEAYAPWERHLRVPVRRGPLTE